MTSNSIINNTYQDQINNKIHQLNDLQENPVAHEIRNNELALDLEFANEAAVTSYPDQELEPEYGCTEEDYMCENNIIRSEDLVVEQANLNFDYLEKHFLNYAPTIDQKLSEWSKKNPQGPCYGEDPYYTTYYQNYFEEEFDNLVNKWILFHTSLDNCMQFFRDKNFNFHEVVIRQFYEEMRKKYTCSPIYSEDEI